MYIALSIVHLLVTLGLILIVLLQSGKGADIGAAFGGGSSQTVFGGRGAATFLTKLTTALAVLFMLTSLTLTILASQRGGSTVVGEEAPRPTQSAPRDAGSPAPAAPVPPTSGGQAPAAPAAPAK
jgi:preprotein translocase subunit SecG